MLGIGAFCCRLRRQFGTHVASKAEFYWKFALNDFLWLYYNDSLSQVVFFPDSNNDAVNRRLPINTESKVRWINCMLRFLFAVYIFTLDSNTTLQMQNDDFTGQLACIFLNYYSLHMSSLTHITIVSFQTNQNVCLRN